MSFALLPIAEGEKSDVRKRKIRKRWFRREDQWFEVPFYSNHKDVLIFFYLKTISLQYFIYLIQ